MQLKIVAFLILFICLVYPLSGKPLPGQGCCKCEEEVWEEVTCANIPQTTSSIAPISTTATTITATTIVTTAPPLLSTNGITRQPSPGTTPALLTKAPTSKSPYKKCYCQCKSRCKDFCSHIVSKVTEPTNILQKELISEAGRSHPNNNENHAPADTNGREAVDYTMPQRYSLPIVSNHGEESEVQPEPYPVPYYKKINIGSKDYFAKPIAPLIAPVYAPYATGEAAVINNFHQFNPYLVGSQPVYYSPHHSNVDYDYPLPLGNVYSKGAKFLFNPLHSIQVPSEDSIGKMIKSRIMSNALPASAINSPLTQRDALDHYDDSIGSVLRNAISNNPLPYNGS